MKQTTFMGQAMRDLIENGVSVVFKSRRRNSGQGLNTFDPFGAIPILTVLNFNKNWVSNFEVFIHEYCHFLQWKDGTDIFKNGVDSLQKLEEYCDGTRNDFEENDLAAIQLLEIDCDRRVLEFNRKHKLGINEAAYSQESNAYIYSYRFIMENRKYDFGADIYFNAENIRATVPDVLFTLEELKQDVPALREIFNKSSKTSL